METGRMIAKVKEKLSCLMVIPSEGSSKIIIATMVCMSIKMGISSRATGKMI